MATQKFMGAGQLVDRLREQLRTQKNPPTDLDGAVRSILQARGHMDKHGKLTKEGQIRNAMTAKDRALDRASTRTGKSADAFKYNPSTNRATIRK
jgi:proline racemase